MKRVGIIGGPDRKSLSPVFQQAALDALGLDMVYESWPTAAEGLADRVASLRDESVLGANVTIPHKEAVLPLIDEVDETVSRVGAVNTIRNVRGRLFGHNTDVEGFLRGLRDDGGFDSAGKKALVAGAGGAARAVVVALIEARASAVTVINRTYGRASRLIEDLRPHASSTSLHALPDIYASWASSVVGCELLVNCTPAGSVRQSGGEEEDPAVPTDVLHSGMLVYDLIYLPAETPLLSAARGRGCKVLGGLPMLVYQGAASFKMWTGREAPVAVMFEAARSTLGLARA
jgi:shikimate dehydrogenase